MQPKNTHMAFVHFPPSFNLPDTWVWSINGIAKLLFPTFKKGWKYYFTQVSDCDAVSPDGKRFRHYIKCISFPIEGGKAYTETVCHSNWRIRF